MTHAKPLTVAVILGSLALLGPGAAAADRAQLGVTANVIRSSRIEVSATRVDAERLRLDAPGLISVEQQDGPTRTALQADATGAWRMVRDGSPVVVTVLADAQ